MVTGSWTWKSKDGRSGGLLYEPGNWGDLLKVSWLVTVADWLVAETVPLAYFDPFAGQAGYPLGRNTGVRFRRAGLDALSRVAPYVDHGCWPSAALLMRDLYGCPVTVFDADAGRLDSWRDAGVSVARAESGWQAAADRDPGADTLWLLDPYDFLAEWRDVLSMVVERSRRVTTLVYTYNRSAGKPAHFAEYRTFRNRLDDMLEGTPRSIGRVASDSFLPRAHHEMLLLPSDSDRARASFSSLAETLEGGTKQIVNAIERCSCFI